MRTHGDSKSPEYNAWNAMRGRCLNEKHPSFAHYGGRGIKLCGRWLIYENFLKDMGRRTSPMHTLERRDNNGPYTKWNCRWATRQEQVLNTRHNRIVEVRGQQMPLSSAAKILGITWDMARYRIRKGRSLEGPKGKHDRHAAAD